MNVTQRKIRPITFLIFLSFFFFSLNSVEGQITSWVNRFGGNNSDIANSIASDLDGNIYTTGTFTGAATFGTLQLSSATSIDIFLTKTDGATGNTIWAKRYGGLSDDYAYSVTTSTNGYVYCAGRFSGNVLLGTSAFSSVGAFDAYVMKIDALNGSVVWAKKMSGMGSDAALSIAVDKFEQVYVTGYYQGNAIFGAYSLTAVGTNYNIFLTKLDGATGAFAWAKSMGGLGFNVGNSIAADTLGNLIMCGNFESSAVFETFTLTAMGNSDAFVAKINATSGSVLWAKRLGGQGNDGASGVILGNEGDIYVAGKFELTSTFGTYTLNSVGSSDIFVTKLENNLGNVSWSNAYGGNGFDLANGVSKDALGNLFITGQFSGSMAFNTNTLIAYGNADAFVFRISSDNGLVNWSTHLGGTNADSGNSITTDKDGKIFVTGSFQLVGTFETYTLSAAGAADIFIVNLNPLLIGFGESSFSEIDLELYPNPCKDYFSILLPENNMANYQLTISDVAGKIVLNKNYDIGTYSIDISQLNKEVYFISVKTENQVYKVKKLIKN